MALVETQNTAEYRFDCIFLQIQTDSFISIVACSTGCSRSLPNIIDRHCIVDVAQALCYSCIIRCHKIHLASYGAVAVAYTNLYVIIMITIIIIIIIIMCHCSYSSYIVIKAVVSCFVVVTVCHSN